MNLHSVPRKVPEHTCEICGYKTIYKSDLTKHRRKHTGEKPYRCPICFKEFSDSSILRRHEVVHTGEKPWKCYLCDKAYTLRSTLTNHFKKVNLKKNRYRRKDLLIL